MTYEEMDEFVERDWKKKEEAELHWCVVAGSRLVYQKLDTEHMIKDTSIRYI